MKISLRFEASVSGQLEGINDAGIETFAGDHLGGLAREQGQNSMDAKGEKAKGPVEVRYELLDVARGDLPGAAELKAALVKIKEFWSEKGREDQKAQKAADRALKLLAQKTIPVLRISDRNTTGLRGSSKHMTGDWFSLTKSTGVSLKGEGKLGSFGIGKNVFWANSKLRMVYFATHDIDDQWAFQGVAKWAAHRLSKKMISRAIGFCGQEEGFAPIRGKQDIPKLFRPDGVGTDIFLAGFVAGAHWQTELIEAFARNFFVAFHKDLLRVQIGEHELSAANIGDVIEALSQESPANADLKTYWDALASKDAFEFEETFPLLGKVRLRLLLKENANKSVAMFRGTGMMIFEKKHFRTPLQFAGVCICDNKKGNEFLRRLEPPSHTAWEPERHEDPQAASDEINSFYKWLRECVNKLSPAAQAESLDVPELEHFLPDEDDEIPLEKAKGAKEGDPRQEEHTLEGRVRRERARPDSQGEEERETEVEGVEEGETGGGEGDGEGHGDGGGGGGDSQPEEGGGEQVKEPEPVTVHYRIFKQPGVTTVYTMRADLPAKGKYSVAVSSIGDDGGADPIRPASANQRLADGTLRSLSIGTGADIKLTGIEVPKAGLATVEVEIPSLFPLSLSARFYRHG